MAKLFKPLYQCEGCGETFENPDKVRIFNGEVTNGDELKSFIRPTQMYCLNCLKHSLDYNNDNPETVIVKNESQTKDHQYQSNINIREILNNEIQQINDRLDKFDEFRQETVTNLELVTKNIKKHTDIENLLKEKFFELEEQLGKFNNSIVENQDEFLEEGGTELFDGRENSSEETPQEEPETTTKIIDSETDQDVVEDLIPLKTSGRYLVLYKIKSEEHEEDFAKRCNHKDAKSLRETYGNKSLTGIYYSIDKFTDTLEDFSYEYRQETIKVVNKIFFGVPNVVERQAYVYSDLGIALIEKQIFEDKIEPIIYEIPEEIEEAPPVPVSKISAGNAVLKDVIESIKTKESSSNIYKNESVTLEEIKKISSETRKPVITSIQKKKFSRDVVGDEYI